MYIQPLEKVGPNQRFFLATGTYHIPLIHFVLFFHEVMKRELVQIHPLPEGATARSNGWGASPSFPKGAACPLGTPRGLEQLINFPPISLIFTLEYR